MATDQAMDADMVIRRHVLRNTISNYLGKAVALGTAFFLTPFILHNVGSTMYGLWVLVGAAIGYGALLDLGISSTVVKYVAEYRIQGETEQARNLVATALCLYAGLGLIAIVISVALAPVFPVVFHVPPAERGATSWLVILMGVAIGMAIPCTTTTAVLRGLHRFDLANLISGSGTIISASATIVVLLLHGGVLGMVAINIAVMLVMQAPAIWLINRIAPELRPNWRGVQRRLMRTIISFSSSLFAIQLGSRLQTKTDEVVIAVFLPLSAVTPYALARGLSETAQLLTDQFMKVLLPLASELHAENDQARLRLLYITSTRLTLAIFLPIGCMLVILARPILTAWVGAQYAGAADLVTILTIASFINTSQWPASSVLQGMARHRPLALMALGSGLVNLALSVALAPRLGLIGVALSTLIPTAIECLGIVLPYAMQVIGVSMREVIGDIAVPALLPAVPTVTVLYILEHVADPSSLLAILAIGTVSLLVYGGVYLKFGACGFERDICCDVTSAIVDVARGTLRRSTAFLARLRPG